MTAYVDFDRIKAQVTFQQIFAHYGIAVVRERGSELTIHCPFHHDTRPSLKANVERLVFKCFGCGAKDDVIAFVQHKEGIASGDRNRERVAAARLIVRLFGMTEGKLQEMPEGPVAVRGPEIMAAAHDSEETAPETNALETAASNPVLTFRLKLDPSHAYLRERGLRPDTIEHFGLCYCNRGLMKGRVAIPIENEQGLVAYAGRWPGRAGGRRGRRSTSCLLGSRSRWSCTTWCGYHQRRGMWCSSKATGRSSGSGRNWVWRTWSLPWALTFPSATGTVVAALQGHADFLRW